MSKFKVNPLTGLLDLVGGAPAGGGNIYSADGTLQSTRTVTQNSNALNIQGGEFSQKNLNTVTELSIQNALDFAGLGIEAVGLLANDGSVSSYVTAADLTNEAAPSSAVKIGAINSDFATVGILNNSIIQLDSTSVQLSIVDGVTGDVFGLFMSAAGNAYVESGTAGVSGLILGNLTSNTAPTLGAQPIGVTNAGEIVRVGPLSTEDPKQTVNLVANTPLVVTATLLGASGEVRHVTLRDSTGRDITSEVSIIYSGINVTLESTVNLTGVVVCMSGVAA